MVTASKPNVSIEILLSKLNSWYVLYQVFFHAQSSDSYEHYLLMEKHINEDIYRIRVYGNGWQNQLYFGSDIVEVVRIWNGYKPKEAN